MHQFQPRSFHLQWHITERCNLHCKHCYQDPLFLKHELNIKKLIKILDNFIKQIQKWQLPRHSVRISFTGGEPLLRSDFIKLLQKCFMHRDIFMYGVLTNGVLIDKNYIEILKKFKIDYIQVSIEGEEKVNDYIRGKGVFKKIIQSVKLLKQAGLSVGLSMTVSKINLKNVPVVAGISRDLGVSFGIRRLLPSGQGKNIENEALSPLEVQALWRTIIINYKESPIGLGCEDGILTQDFPYYRPGECSAGYASFTILPNGDVYPCRRLPIYAGNLLKESFEKIYYNSKSLKDLRNLNNINDVCYVCPNNVKCLGGAKCMSFSYFKDAFSPDPQCWRLFDELPDSGLKWQNSSETRHEKLNHKWIQKFDL